MMTRNELLRRVKRRGTPALLFLLLCCVACTGSAADLPDMQTLPMTHPYDAVIHGWTADELAEEVLDNTGEEDVSGLLNRAIERLFNAGGGTLYLPAGMYRLDQPVFVRPGTALRGDFTVPGCDHPVDPASNTVICAYYGRDMDEQAGSLFIRDGSSLIDGLVIWYPEQKERNVVPYAPSIRQVEVDAEWAINSAARNIFLVNAYTGIQLGTAKKGTCIELVKNIYGTPLRSGVEVWRDADIPRILGVDFNPDYWPSAKLGSKSISRMSLKRYLFENASGITYHRTDGSALANITIRGYNKGLELADGHKSDKYNQWLDNEGHYINFNITECYDAVWIQNIKNHGTQFYNSVLDGKRAAVYVGNPMHGMECAMFLGCTLSGREAALMQEWAGKPNDKFSLMFSACNFESPIQWTGGNLIVADSDFNSWKDHLSVGPNAEAVIVADSRFKGKRRIENRAGGRFKMNESREPYISAPDYVYDVNRISTYKPPQTNSVFVRAGDGQADDTQRIQQAMDEISGKGGGYVVLYPGLYVLKRELTVRENVELRGPVQSWQHSKFLSYYAEKGEVKSAVIFVEQGRDAEESAAITLEQNAGLDGLFFHYPGQEYNAETNEVLHKYGWLIRMRGDRSYVKHVTASNPWRFIDLHSQDAKDTYIGYCTGAPLEQGISVGEAEHCTIDNVHFNSWYWNTVYFPNKPSVKGKNGYKEDLDNWRKANTQAFIFAGSRNLDMYGSFIFCSNRAHTLLPGKTSGKGPDGIIINSGCDWSKFGLTMHANNGLVFVNTHFIIVDQYDPDPDISSMVVTEGCADSIDFYNLSTWGTCHRALALYGTETSGVNIYNFSNQLYDPQVNDIHGGHVRMVSSIRNVPRHPITFNLGSEASVIMHAGISDAPVQANPPNMKKTPESSDVNLSDIPPGVIRSLSFP